MYSKLKDSAEDMWNRSFPIKAERGKIYDCNNKILVAWTLSVPASKLDFNHIDLSVNWIIDNTSVIFLCLALHLCQFRISGQVENMLFC